MEDKLLKYKNKGLTGLSNVGNSCYINSCVQILSNTYELNEFLDNLKKNKINNNVEGIMINEWNNLRKLIWSENCTVAPWGFIKAIQHVASKKNQDIFTGFMQNDVTEFLFFIIDCFHNGLKREVDMSINGDIKNNKDSLAILCFKMMKNMYKKEYSEILDIFYGISVTQINSLDGNILSRSCEPFSILTLSLPNKKECNIFDCFNIFCAEEDLKEENSWYNEKTKKKENVKKNVYFWSLPKILIIDLKRFNNDIDKINLLVNTNFTDIDFSKYVKGYNSNDYIYDLFGCVDHTGNLDGGHYTANIKNPNGKWYNFNDTAINEIPEKNVITSNTYCLFYRKKK